MTAAIPPCVAIPGVEHLQRGATSADARPAMDVVRAKATTASELLRMIQRINHAAAPGVKGENRRIFRSNTAVLVIYPLVAEAPSENASNPGSGS